MFFPSGWLIHRFPPDRGVDLGEEGSGHLDEGDSAQIATRGEPSDVADYPASERDHDAVAREARSEQPVHDVPKSIEGLVLLPVVEDYPLRLSASDGADERVQVEGCNRFAADHHHLAAFNVRCEQLGSREQAATDVYRVAAPSQVHLQRFRGGQDA